MWLMISCKHPEVTVSAISAIFCFTCLVRLGETTVLANAHPITYILFMAYTFAVTGNVSLIIYTITKYVIHRRHPKPDQSKTSEIGLFIFMLL